MHKFKVDEYLRELDFAYSDGTSSALRDDAFCPYHPKIESDRYEAWWAGWSAVMYKLNDVDQELMLGRA